MNQWSQIKKKKHSKGAYLPFTYVILADIFRGKKLSSAFGMLMSFQGLALFVNYFITMELFKENRSIFIHISGLTIIISGLMCFLIPRFKSYKQLTSIDSVVESNQLTQI